MHDILRVALVTFLLLMSNPVHGSEDEWRVSPKPTETSAYRTKFMPTGEKGAMTPPSVRNLPSTNDGPRTQGILAMTTWLKGAFSTEAEVAANQANPASDHPSSHMMRLGVIGSTKRVRYGMTYRTADQEFVQRAGQEQREAWGEWGNGAWAIRSTVGQLTYFEADAAVNRQEQRYNRINVSWNKPAWPHLGLSYVHNAASNTMDALSLFPQRANHHKIEAVVGYGDAMWDARLSSAYGLETDLLQHAADSRVQTETLTASFRPISILTITPTIGYRMEEQPWSGVRINSPSASISMNYKQSQRLNLTAMGNYFSMRSSDRLIDFDMIGGKGIVSWELEPVKEWKPQVSLEGGYNLQVNRLMPSAQTENLSGLLRLVLATM